MSSVIPHYTYKFLVEIKTEKFIVKLLILYLSNDVGYNLCEIIYNKQNPLILSFVKFATRVLKLDLVRTKFVLHQFFWAGSNVSFFGNPLQGTFVDLILCEHEIHYKGRRLDLANFDLEFATKVFKRLDLVGMRDLLQGSET